jgi:hypothetical protein
MRLKKDCHPRGIAQQCIIVGDPQCADIVRSKDLRDAQTRFWIPAFAGMTAVL